MAIKIIKQGKQTKFKKRRLRRAQRIRKKLGIDEGGARIEDDNIRSYN